MKIVSNCPLCEQKSLHVLGEDEYLTQQCINCGYVTSEKFKLNGELPILNKSYRDLTNDMKDWCIEMNDRIWIPTIMTLPVGMLYPINDKEKKIKWSFAEMVDIPEKERKNYPVEGDSGKFYERRIDTENAKEFDIFVEALAEVNNVMKKKSKEEKPIEKKIKLPKLKKTK